MSKIYSSLGSSDFDANHLFSPAFSRIETLRVIHCDDKDWHVDLAAVNDTNFLVCLLG